MCYFLLSACLLFQAAKRMSKAFCLAAEVFAVQYENAINGHCKQLSLEVQRKIAMENILQVCKNWKMR